MKLEELTNDTTEVVNENTVKWTGMTRYTQLKDSSGYFLHIPENKPNDIEKEIKAKLNLKDSIFIYRGKTDRIAALIYKRKPCIVDIDCICLRVERYVGDQRKDTKFVLINLKIYD